MVCFKMMKKFINIILENSETHRFFNTQNPQKLAYYILEVQENSSAKDIKRSYLSLMKQFHPDQYTTANLRVQEKMSEKTKMINWAYHEIKKVTNLK